MNIRKILNLLFEKPLAVVFLVLSGTSILVWIFYSRLANINWDEALHTYTTYLIYTDLRTLNLSSFIRHTLTQTYYPFLQSWVMSIPALIFGFSIEKNRLFSLIWFVLIGMLVFYNARKIGRETKLTNRWAVAGGYLSAIFLITSPLYLYLSGTGMKEAMGAFLIIFILTAYFQARQKNTPFSYILISFEIFLLLMFKYNYGILLVGIIGLEGLISLVFEKNKVKTVLSHLLIILPFLFMALCWLYFPVAGLEEPKPTRFWKVIANTGPGLMEARDFITKILFYPRAILYTYAFSPVAGVFLLGMIAGALRFVKNLRVRVLLIGLLANLLSAGRASWNMQERYIFTTIPFLYVLGGFGGIYYLKIILTKIGGVRPILRGLILGGGLVLVVILIKDLVALPQYVYSVASYTTKSPVFNQRDYNDQYFEYNRGKWPKIMPDGNFEKPADALDYVVSRVDLSKPVSVIGQTTELSPDYFNLKLAMAKESKIYPHIPDYAYFLVTLELLPGSILITYDYKHFNSYVYQYVKEVAANPNLTLLQQKAFKDLGVEIRVYGGK